MRPNKAVKKAEISEDLAEIFIGGWKMKYGNFFEKVDKLINFGKNTDN